MEGQSDKSSTLSDSGGLIDLSVLDSVSDASKNGECSLGRGCMCGCVGACVGVWVHVWVCGCMCGCGWCMCGCVGGCGCICVFGALMCVWVCEVAYYVCVVYVSVGVYQHQTGAIVYPALANLSSNAKGQRSS